MAAKCFQEVAERLGKTGASRTCLPWEFREVLTFIKSPLGLSSFSVDCHSIKNIKTTLFPPTKQLPALLGCPSVFLRVPNQTENSEGQDSGFWATSWKASSACTREALLGSGSQLGTEGKGVTPSWGGQGPLGRAGVWGARLEQQSPHLTPPLWSPLCPVRYRPPGWVPSQLV